MIDARSEYFPLKDGWSSSFSKVSMSELKNSPRPWWADVWRRSGDDGVTNCPLIEQILSLLSALTIILGKGAENIKYRNVDLRTKKCS